MRDPVSLAPVPQPVPASRPPGCGQCSPRTEPPRGAQEGSRTISCPPLPLLAPSDPVPRACGCPCASRGTKRRLPGAQRLPPRVALASLTSSSPPESLDAALAFGSDSGPPPPARARLLSDRGATSPRSRLGSAPLGSGSPRHRGWRRFFLQRSPLRPSPDVKAGGGTRRPAQEGAATRGDLPAPVPRPGAQPSTPTGYGGGGPPALDGESGLTQSFRRVPPRAHRSWAAGLGKV